MNLPDFVDRTWVKIRMEKGVRRIHTATKLPVSKDQTGELIKSVFEVVAEILEEGQTVHIPGFGKFTPKQQAPGSEIYDPRKKVKVPRRPDRMRSVRFKASKVLLDHINPTATPTG